MADETEDDTEEEKKPSKLPLILGLVAALVGGGGGFFAAFSGMLFAPETSESAAAEKEEEPEALPDVAYVPIEPIMVSMTPVSAGRHLRFRAQLEVPTKYKDDVESIVPRVMDILNGYLRALETRDIEDASALIRIRAQMLRRIQVVAGEGRVRDLLIMEFVLT